MDTFNLFRGDTIDDESDPPGYRAQSAQLAPRFGASRLAMTVYDLPPGQAICPFHFHWGDEEWLIVVSGTPTVRTSDGERTLEPGDVACFLVGPQGAHRVHNASDDLSASPFSRTSTSSASSNIRTATRLASGAGMTSHSTTRFAAARSSITGTARRLRTMRSSSAATRFLFCLVRQSRHRASGPARQHQRLKVAFTRARCFDADRMRRAGILVCLLLAVGSTATSAAARSPRLERLALTPADNRLAAGAQVRKSDLAGIPPGWLPSRPRPTTPRRSAPGRTTPPTRSPDARRRTSSPPRWDTPGSWAPRWTSSRRPPTNRKVHGGHSSGNRRLRG